MTATLESTETTAPFGWLPLRQDQFYVVEQLFEAYRKRYGLPGEAKPYGQLWFAIVDRSNGKIAGVVGVNVDAPTATLEITGLYVYPNRAGVRAFEATQGRLVELYQTGAVRALVCTALFKNRRMNEAIQKKWYAHGGSHRANVYVMGDI